MSGGRAVDAQRPRHRRWDGSRPTLALAGNRAALADLNGQWIDRFHDRNGLKYIVLDMDSSVSPTHGDQEGSAWNGHFDRSCYHPNFLFNQFGMLNAAPCAMATSTAPMAGVMSRPRNCALRGARPLRQVLPGRCCLRSRRSMSDWKKRGSSTPSGCPQTRSSSDKIAHRQRAPCRAAVTTKVKRFFEEFSIRRSWDKERRVIAKIEWHPGELFPRVGFIVTNLPMEPDWWCGSQPARHRRAAH
nr:transposase [Enterobacter cloacae complex sp. ECL68]